MAVVYAAGMNFGVAASQLHCCLTARVMDSAKVWVSTLERYRATVRLSAIALVAPTLGDSAVPPTVAANPRFVPRTTKVAVCGCLPLPAPSAMEAGSSAARCFTTQVTLGPMHGKMPNIDR